MLAILRLSVNLFPMLLKENFLRLTFVRSTVKTRQFLCLTANFFSVLQLRVNLIETVSKNTSANKEITHCIEFILKSMRQVSLSYSLRLEGISASSYYCIH